MTATLRGACNKQKKTKNYKLIQLVSASRHVEPLIWCLQKKNIIKILVDVIPDIHAIYVYGSTVNATMRKDSDLDIAILFHKRKSPDMVLILNIKAELEQIVARPVDIGILSTENPVYAKEVSDTGKRIYCNDKQLCMYDSELVEHILGQIQKSVSTILMRFDR